jgi:hypothetical protein
MLLKQKFSRHIRNMFLELMMFEQNCSNKITVLQTVLLTELQANSFNCSNHIWYVLNRNCSHLINTCFQQIFLHKFFNKH